MYPQHLHQLVCHQHYKKTWFCIFEWAVWGPNLTASVRAELIYLRYTWTLLPWNILKRYFLKHGLASLLSYSVLEAPIKLPTVDIGLISVFHYVYSKRNWKSYIFR